MWSEKSAEWVSLFSHAKYRDGEARKPGVVASSANAMPLDIQRGLKAGFFRYITKPIKVNEFMDALEMALGLAGEESEKSE